MNEHLVEEYVADWSDVHKKGQLSLWLLLGIAESKKHAGQLTAFMSDATNGSFRVKEQSIYRALRRFENMQLVSVTRESSPNSGPKHKYYQLTEIGEQVVGRFVAENIAPLLKPSIITLLQSMQKKGASHD